MAASKKAFIALCILCSATNLAWVTNPAIAYIIHDYQDVPASTVTTILTLPGIVALLVSFCIGPLALKFNKKYLLLVSVSITMIYYGTFIIVGSQGPFIALLAAAGILGISRGSSNPLINSIIGEFMPPEKRAVYVAACSSITQGGSGLIMIAGGWIAAGNGGADWPQAHYLGFFCIPAMIAFALLMPKQPDTPVIQAQSEAQQEIQAQVAAQSNAREAAPNTDIVEAAPEKGIRDIPAKVFAIIGLHFAFMLCITAHILYSSVYIVIEHRLGTSADAGMVSSSFTMIAVVIGLSYRIWDKLFTKWIAPLGYALVGLAFVVMLSFTTTIAGVWAASALLSIGMNFANPHIVSRIMSLTPQKLIPVTMSFHVGCTNMSMFLAPFVLSFLGGFLGGGVMGAFRVAAVVLPCCAIGALFLFSRSPKRTI